MATIEVTRPSSEEANWPAAAGHLAVSQANTRNHLTPKIVPSAVSLLQRFLSCCRPISVEERALQGRVKGCSQIRALAPATKRGVYTNRETAISCARRWQATPLAMPTQGDRRKIPQLSRKKTSSLSPVLRGDCDAFPRARADNVCIGYYSGVISGTVESAVTSGE